MLLSTLKEHISLLNKWIFINKFIQSAKLDIRTLTTSRKYTFHELQCSPLHSCTERENVDGIRLACSRFLLLPCTVRYVALPLALLLRKHVQVQTSEFVR